MGAATITPWDFDFSQALDVALLMMTMPREEMCSVMIMAIIALCVMLMAGSERRQCQSCSNWTDLQTATCDLCNVEKDTSFQRDLLGVDPSDRQSL